jgi:hypothetical protein
MNFGNFLSIGKCQSLFKSPQNTDDATLNNIMGISLTNEAKIIFRSIFRGDGAPLA